MDIQIGTCELCLVIVVVEDTPVAKFGRQDFCHLKNEVTVLSRKRERDVKSLVAAFQCKCFLPVQARGHGLTARRWENSYQDMFGVVSRPRILSIY